MAATIYDWSTTAANNSSADTDINWAEGQTAGSVNNSAREMMRKIKQWIGDRGGSISGGGSANAITVTANSAFASYADGQTIAFRATATNTGATTLNVNSIGAKSVRKMAGAGDLPLTGGEIISGGIYIAFYSTAANSAGGGWVLSAMPAGRIFHSSVATTSGTTADFTNIPAGVTEIDLMLNTVSTNGASLLIVQIGTSGGIQTTTYSSTGSYLQASTAITLNTATTGYLATAANAANEQISGLLRFSLMDSATGLWVMQGITQDVAATTNQNVLAGIKALAGTLDRVRLTSVSADTFDLGSVALAYRF